MIDFIEGTPMQNIEISVVYDNNPFDQTLQPDWGFSCFIRGLDRTILFDTGGSGEILLKNLSKMGISPDEIDIIFLSHEHYDHIGGLAALLDKTANCDVCIPNFFSDDLKDMILKKNGHPVKIHEMTSLGDNAYTTGVISGWIKEQSLVLEIPKGLILLTGCAHPRIITIIQTVRSYFKQDIYMVIGGFHLGAYETDELKEIIHSIREAGIIKIGPAHCSGEEARQLFFDEYQDNYLKIGAGKVIRIE